jgi:hypothetical protein
MLPSVNVPCHVQNITLVCCLRLTKAVLMKLSLQFRSTDTTQCHTSNSGTKRLITYLHICLTTGLQLAVERYNKNMEFNSPPTPPPHHQICLKGCINYETEYGTGHPHVTKSTHISVTCITQHYKQLPCDQAL